MVSRFFIIFIFLVSIIEATILKDVKVEGNTLKLYFNTPLKKEQVKAFIMPSGSITKYIFDFKNSKKLKKIPYRYNFTGGIKDVRISQHKPNVIRCVIDSKVKYNLRYSQRDDAIFNIELPLDAFYKKPKKRAKKIAKKGKKTIKKEKLDSVALFKNIDKPKKIDYEIKDNLLKPTLKSKYLIYLDPGHGGHDSGAYVAGVKEKDIVLQIAKRAYRKLKRLGYRVKMTRYKDKFIKLSQRTKKANRDNADIFVSIHANSIDNKKRREKVRGLETYFLQTSRTARAKRIAAKENRVLLNSKDKTTQNVLLNAVFTGPKIELSHKLAISVQREILNSVKRAYYIKDNGVDGAPFRVLAGAQTPAILVEVGYLSNSKDRKLLKKRAYQEKIADGIVKGIIKYLKYREMELN